MDNFKEWYSVEDFENTMGYYYMPSGDDVTPISIEEPHVATQNELCEEAMQYWMILLKPVMRKE